LSGVAASAVPQILFTQITFPDRESQENTMKQWRVIYLNLDVRPGESKRLTEEFDDFNQAINFYASHGGPVLATIWQMTGLPGDSDDVDGFTEVSPAQAKGKT
jgi:hypothetical protein